MFLLLIIVKIVVPDLDIDVPFSIIVGWLGIVIGFFFNQQFADELKRKLSQSERNRENLKLQSKHYVDDLRIKYKGTLEDTTETYEEKIFNLLQKIESQK